MKRWRITYRWLGWRATFALHRIPNGWRIGEAWVLLALLALVAVLLSGCYLEHEAEPCTDSGVMPMAGGQAVNLLRSRDAGSNPATSTMMRGSSVAERRTHNPEDAGSIPVPATTCPGPIVGGECFKDIHDVVSQ